MAYRSTKRTMNTIGAVLAVAILGLACVRGDVLPAVCAIAVVGVLAIL